ncbi:uncharacterized protein Z519_05176 [Cladophialophora bantiana CBS 173.52]|uniref:Uncharacterized protein n=1 Tax=Cladophialophora bantiana (strain ATCC 10958 / CBS 173.52 / CDC B-1940 / NIH 8579) TaxID=1442370 RepID=A0A0D2EVK4_CLAB1|nr:uncharacterized protein Z519_05176 [Cladophialophora bantiana CBS 173.52]KIW93861.1 hypothetical protein Z519_05176 [Cladophialophora bantiana CBS 173.52]
MVFDPSSPIRVFARKQVVVPRSPKPQKEEAAADKKVNEMSPASVPRSSSPSSGLRRGISRLMRQSQDRLHQPPTEVSRWSKTTTESEISDALSEPRSFLKKKSKLKRQSKDTTNSSPTDPFYDPVTRQLQPIGDIPPVLSTSRDDEPPRTMYSSDSDTSSELDPTSPIIHRASSVRVSRPHIVQHSNSSGGSVSKLYVPHSTPTSMNDAPCIGKASQTLGEGLKSLYDLTPTVKKSEKTVVPGGPGVVLKALEGQEVLEMKDDNITALPQVPAEVSNEPRDTMKETILEWPDTPTRIEALDTLPTPFGGFGSVRISRTSDATYSTSLSTNATYVSPPSIVTDGLHSNPPSENDKKLSRAISAPVRNPARRVMIRPTDLIINKGAHDHKLFRENIVSTPYPARHSSIGEIDEISSHRPQETGAKTLQLRRSRPLSYQPEKSEQDDEKAADDESKNTTTGNNNNTREGFQDEKRDLAPEIPFSTKPTLLSPAPVPPATAKSDRFPSPSGPEILFLDLCLTRHPSARVTVEIEVTDKATFDDEQLFSIVRDKYVTKLMGRGRWWFCARTLEGASSTSGSDVAGTTSQPFARGVPFWLGQQQQVGGGSTGGGAGDFDGADFVRHLLKPRVGRRRKMWLLWLRNKQHHDSHGNNNNNNNNNNSPTARRGSRSYLPQQQHTGYGGYGCHGSSSPQQQGGEANNATSPVFSFVHSRNNSDGIKGYNIEPSPTTQAHGPSNGVGFGFGFGAGGSGGPALTAKQPSISLPRMPFQASSTPMSFHRTKSLAALTNGSSSSSSIFSPSSSYATNPHPTYLAQLQHQHLQHPQRQGPPRIHLHHTFSAISIALFTLLLLLLSSLTATFWILFGYPGRSAAAGDGATTVGGHEYTLSWRRDAQARVGVGLVMGVVVLLVGVAGEVGWVWASWVLV